MFQKNIGGTCTWFGWLSRAGYRHFWSSHPIGDWNFSHHHPPSKSGNFSCERRPGCVEPNLWNSGFNQPTCGHPWAPEIFIPGSSEKSSDSKPSSFSHRFGSMLIFRGECISKKFPPKKTERFWHFGPRPIGGEFSPSERLHPSCLDDFCLQAKWA